MSFKELIFLLVFTSSKGPLLSGTIVNWIGFEGLVTVTSLICFIFVPFMLLLRKPPPLNENQVSIKINCLVLKKNETEKAFFSTLFYL